jgi:hypothetical protein
MASKLVRLTISSTMKLSARRVSLASASKWFKATNSVSNGLLDVKTSRLLTPAINGGLNKLTLLKNNYASQEKPTKSQLEERVLDLLRHFDRVKENPAKPEVIMCIFFISILNHLTRIHEILIASFYSNKHIKI